MNQKKAKTLRKMLRSQGVDPKQVKVIVGPKVFGQLDSRPHLFTRQITMAPCGRLAYHEAKRLAGK